MKLLEFRKTGPNDPKRIGEQWARHLLCQGCASKVTLPPKELALEALPSDKQRYKITFVSTRPKRVGGKEQQCCPLFCTVTILRGRSHAQIRLAHMIRHPLSWKSLVVRGGDKEP